MNRKVFLAGATGVIGTALVPLLIDAGYTVYGGTRRPERAASLEAAGAVPVVVDVFDRDALAAALARIAPSGVVHQLTDLPPGLDPSKMAQALVNNARVRDEGTRNLVAAGARGGLRAARRAEHRVGLPAGEATVCRNQSARPRRRRLTRDQRARRGRARTAGSERGAHRRHGAAIRAPVRTARRARVRCTSKRRRTRRCSRSRTRRAASTTSPRIARKCRATRRGASSAGGPTCVRRRKPGRGRDARVAS
jgi:NAD(P)-dependent dehydrogenase (short-subunit alcohol dehydrogenase family)